MRSLKSLLDRYINAKGLATPQSAQSAEAIAREALQKVRPDLLLFYVSARKKGPELIITLSHPAAAQEGAMVVSELLPLVQEALGAASVAKIAFVSGDRRGPAATG